jgi:hypothetical protein
LAATVVLLNPTGTVETVSAGSVATVQRETVKAAVRRVNGRMDLDFLRLRSLGRTAQA